jgi:4a-hydroxytetrahydrobiopterin dehydratase
MTSTPPENDHLRVSQFRAEEGMQNWPVLSDGATTFFRTGSFADSVRLLQTIAAIEGVEAHKPDIDVRPQGVTVRLITAEERWRGMSRRDLDMARRITAAAASLGLMPEPALVQSVEPIIIGAVDIPGVMPFWQALLGYVQRPDSPDEDLIDPRGRGPGIWFEQLEGQRGGRNRMHFAVWVPYEQAEARLAAAIAAGGRLIYDAMAPSWWTLVDPEGNEADIATTMSRPF